MGLIQQKTVAILFLALYAGIGFSAHALSGEKGEDAYPFFSWFLFVNVPQRVQTGFDVRIGNLRLLDSPEFRSGLMRREAATLENRIGEAVKSGSAQRIQAARRDIESRLPAGTTYLVREITYDPLEYFTAKSTLRESIIGEFTAP